ncbi:hypothetical protein PIB30_089896 [Stylosanthes scabra]|uniref:Uncharacterized protein n=1 Tax=Stylosanthes scabra TaxID=79078 RepID=A0ABU6VST9_9FABA|nr:hypothetical protein [Stylosanthes scabra]
MENREPEQNHTPRRQLATPRHGSSCPNTWKLCPSVPLATTNSSKPCLGALSQCLGVLLIKAQPHEDQGTPRRHTSTPRHGKLSSSTKLAPRPRPGVLHQRPSVGVSKLIFYDSRLGVEPEVQA